MEELQKLQRKKKVGKVRGYREAKELFWGKEKDVCIEIKELGIESNRIFGEGKKKISKRKIIF